MQLAQIPCSRECRGVGLATADSKQQQQSIREEKMNKIYPIATLLAAILAIVSAFVAIPMAAAALLILGGIGALKNSPDARLRVYAAATILTLGSQTLTSIPVVGDALAAIFAGVATALIGASVVGVVMGISQAVKAGLMK
jgi:hypothetical protein